MIVPEREFLQAWDDTMYPRGPEMPEPVQVAQAGGGLPEMKAYDPTTRERLASFLQSGFEGIGIERASARRYSQSLMGGESSGLPLSLGIADIVPVLGTALQTEEAARTGAEAVQAAKRGDVGEAAMLGGLAAVGMVPGAAGTVKAAKKTAKFIKPKVGEMLSDYMSRSGMTPELMAYHGTPHRFERFEASKIGTGEGAQAYGHGLYFAESPGVAKSYQTKLSEDKFFINNKQIDESNPVHVAAATISFNGGDKAKAINDLRAESLTTYAGEEQKKIWNSAADAIERGDALPEVTRRKGSFYTVDIPDEMVGKMLDWDKPLVEQSQEIQQLAKQYGLTDPDHLGGDLLNAVGAKRAAGAKILSDAGIPGVRYFDQSTRRGNRQEITRNIVVFPGGEDQVKIIKVE